MADFDGKSVLVLGAAGRDNMGQAMARRFASEGAKVMVAGRNPDSLAELAEEIGGAWAMCDIASQSDIDALIETTVDRFGAIDVGINAAGWGLTKPLLDVTQGDLEKMCAVQLIGPFQFFQALLRVMQAGSSIIQISSVSATIILEDYAAYTATKAATDHLIRCIADEFGEKGIRANSIAAGLTDTPMAAGVFGNPVLTGVFRKEYPLGRMGNSGDIAAAALWLASDDCFLTGEILQVNGGATLRRNPRKLEFAAALGA